MSDTAKILIGVLVLAGLGTTVYFIGKKQHWFGYSGLELAILSMANAAKKSGADTFNGMSSNQIIERFSKATISDVNKLNTLFQKGEPSWTPAEKQDFLATWKKITGEDIRS